MIKRIGFLLVVLIGVQQVSYAMRVDPTQPVAISSVRRAELTLSAIFVAPDRKLAVINGHIVHIGDEVGLMKIMAIEPNRVLLSGPQGTEELTLIPHPVHQIGPLH